VDKTVVLINPFFRIGHLFNFCGKYNFKPIIVLSKDSTAAMDLYDDALENTKIIKKRTSNLIIIKDDGTEFNKVVKQLKTKNVVAVIEYDESVIYGEKLREELGLKNNNPSLSANQRDKGWVNEQLTKNNIRVPTTLEYDINKIKITNSFLKEITSKINFPIIIKPFEGAGGMGVSIANDIPSLKSSIDSYLSNAKKYPIASAKILFQQYIGGDEYFFNYQSINGKHLLTDVWETHKIKKGPYTLHHFCNTVSTLNKTLMSANKYCQQVLNAIKWKWGATHVEIKIDKGLAYLIEVNLRNMGAHSIATTPIFYKYCTPELTYLSLIDKTPLLKYFKAKYSDSKKGKCNAFYFINSPKTFTLHKNKIINWAKKNLKTFNDYQPYYKIGATIPEAISMFDGLVGEVGLYGPEKQVKADLLKLEKAERDSFNLLFE